MLVGASEIDDVFDYRALPTGRFLTVTAGEDSARRAHLFSTPIAERAIRRLVDFAEIVLVNVGPLTGVAARSVVSLCDAVVVVTGADIAMQPGYRPAQLHDMRVPIMAWTPDYLSTQDELVDPPAPVAAEPTSDLVPSWIDADHADVAINGHNGSAPPVVAAAPEPTEEALAPAVAHVVHPPEAPADAVEAPVVAPHTPEVAAVAAEAPVGVPAVGTMSAEAAEFAPAEHGDVIVAEQPVPEPTTDVGLADEPAPSVVAVEPEPNGVELEGLRLEGLWEKDSRDAPAPAVADASAPKKTRRKRRLRSRYLP